MTVHQSHPEDVLSMSIGAEGRARAVTAGVGSRPVSAAGLAAITLGAAAWAAAVGAIGIWRDDRFLSHRYDLGNMVQAVWSTAHGRVLDMTDGTTGDQMVRLGAHVDPILVLFTPLWWIHPAPETLIVAFAAVIAAGVYPVVRLALKHTESRLAAGLLGAWYLAYPWTIWIALNELNPIVLALPLLLYAIWFLDEDRLGLFALFAVLAVLTGELVGLDDRAHRHLVRAPAPPAARRPRHRGGRCGLDGDLPRGRDTCLQRRGVEQVLRRLRQRRRLACRAPRDDAHGPGSDSRPDRDEGRPAVPALVGASGCLPLPRAARAPARSRAAARRQPALGAALDREPALPLRGAGDRRSRRRDGPGRRAVSRALPGAGRRGAARVGDRRPHVDPSEARNGGLSLPERAAARAARRDASRAVARAARRAGHRDQPSRRARVRPAHGHDLFPARVGAEWAVLDTRDPSNTTAKWIGPTPFAQLLRRFEPPKPPPAAIVQADGAPAPPPFAAPAASGAPRAPPSSRVDQAPPPPERAGCSAVRRDRRQDPPALVAARAQDREGAQRRHLADPGHRHRRTRDEGRHPRLHRQSGAAGGCPRRPASSAAAAASLRPPAAATAGARPPPAAGAVPRAGRADVGDAQADRRAHGAEPAHVGARALGVRSELLARRARFARRRRRSTSAPARSSPICRSSSRRSSTRCAPCRSSTPRSTATTSSTTRTSTSASRSRSTGA